MPPTQDSQTTFKPNLTCIFLSARAKYIVSNPDGRPCRVVGRYENLKLASSNKRYLNGTSFASILPDSGDTPTPLTISDGSETCKEKYGGGHVVILLGAWKDCAILKGGLISEFFLLWLQSSQKNVPKTSL